MQIFFIFFLFFSKIVAIPNFILCAREDTLFFDWVNICQERHCECGIHFCNLACGVRRILLDIRLVTYKIFRSLLHISNIFCNFALDLKS